MPSCFFGCLEVSYSQRVREIVCDTASFFRTKVGMNVNELEGVICIWWLRLSAECEAVNYE